MWSVARNSRQKHEIETKLRRKCFKRFHNPSRIDLANFVGEQDLKCFQKNVRGGTNECELIIHHSGSTL